jgi:lysyl-tRNA synthetase class 1
LAPESCEIDFILEKLQGYGYGKGGLTDDLECRIIYALNWSKDFNVITEEVVQLSDEENDAITELIGSLMVNLTEEEIQSTVFKIARKNNIKPGKFFKVLYKILLGANQGPRLGPYILAMGIENVIQALKRATKC